MCNGSRAVAGSHPAYESEGLLVTRIRALAIPVFMGQCLDTLLPEVACLTTGDRVLVVAIPEPKPRWARDIRPGSMASFTEDHGRDYLDFTGRRVKLDKVLDWAFKVPARSMLHPEDQGPVVTWVGCTRGPLVGALASLLAAIGLGWVIGL